MSSYIHLNRRLLILTIPFAIALLFVSQSASAQLPPGSVCWSCVQGCAGNGWICDGAAPGDFGSNECAVGNGPVPGRCHCFPGGGVCGGDIAQAPEEAKAMEQQALAVLAAGGALPADGLFYSASRGEHLMLRRKCDGDLVGRVAIADIGNVSGFHRLASRAGD